MEIELDKENKIHDIISKIKIIISNFVHFLI